MPFESSAVPRAIDGLLAICNAAATLKGVSIYDGSPVTRSSDELYLEIATPSDDGHPGVEGTQEFVSLPGRERDEMFSIFCEACARSGNNDIKIERDRAFGIVAAVERLIRPREPGADTTLGGSVMWSSITGRITYTPLQSPEGAAVRVLFEIACRERLSGS